MTPELTIRCQDVEEGDLAARYVAGSLSPHVRDAFEIHLLECTRCLGEVELATAVRRSLPRPAARPGRWKIVAMGAVAATIVTVAVVGTRSTDTDLRAAGAITEAPVYLGVPVRSGRTPDSLFDAAMQAYARAEYRSAADQLRAALSSGASVAPASFFLGASLLMLDDARAARDAFTAVLEAGRGPYHDDARLLRARASLRRGDARAAREDLEQLTREDGPLAAAADSLLTRMGGTGVR